MAVKLDQSGLFVCPNHAGALTLSPAGCGRLYVRAQTAKKARSHEELTSVGLCLGCGIGKAHKALAKEGKQARLSGASLAHESPQTRVERARRGAAMSIANRGHVANPAHS